MGRGSIAPWDHRAAETEGVVGTVTRARNRGAARVEAGDENCRYLAQLTSPTRHQLPWELGCLTENSPRHQTEGTCSKGTQILKSAARGAGEMAHQLGALAALPEDSGSIPSPHVLANNPV